ncbi:hypothetical protein [Streptomyces stackebrandtii]|uniref:hypothetical protein n=1 Tax=Streptomyces stackebrandtii TaxID=3051177 RepID=UPI0028DB90B2|nr:hypothetical protein [Streptomyces sp. DSM 40976]
MSNSIFDRLSRVRVRDILVPGYIARDGNLTKFKPFPVAVYLELEEGFIELATIRDEGRMTIEFVTAPKVPEALLDDDDEFCLDSRGLDVLTDSHDSLRFTQVRGVVRGASPSEAGEPGTEYDCLEFRFEDGWYLFADPGYPLGIRLGGEGAYDRLLELNAGRPTRLTPGRPFVWTP